MGAHWAGQMGGAQFQAQQLVAALAQEGGFSVAYLARRVDHSFVATDHEVVQICNPVGIRRHTFALDWIPLWRSLDRVKPHVIYQRGLSGYTGICAAYSKARAVPFVFHVAHTNDVANKGEIRGTTHGRLGFLDRALGHYGVRRTTAVLAQTADQAKLLRRNFGIDSWAVVRNFHPEARGERVRSVLPRLLWIANWKKLKRPNLFIEFAKAVADTIDAEFVMLGRLAKDQRVSAGVFRIGRNSTLRIEGEVSVEEVERRL